MMLKYTEIALSHREVPGEISLCIYISGCPNKCADCHYPELQLTDYGDLLHLYFSDIVDLYFRQTTCVCFLGEGKSSAEERGELAEYACYAKSKGLKTCLYSGRDVEIEPWMNVFDIIKLGSYQPALGTLDCRTTNQRMYRKESESGIFTDITNLFWA